MVRWIGFSLIVFSAVFLGRALIADAREQIKIMKAFCRDLEYLRSEIEFHLLPLPEILQELTGRTHPVLQKLYMAACNLSTDFPGLDTGTCMIQSIADAKKLPLEVTELLNCFFLDLGKQDAGKQVRVLDDAFKQLKDTISQKECVQRELEQNCRVLCICAGLALAIILI